MSHKYTHDKHAWTLSPAQMFPRKEICPYLSKSTLHVHVAVPNEERVLWAMLHPVLNAGPATCQLMLTS